MFHVGESRAGWNAGRLEHWPFLRDLTSDCAEILLNGSLHVPATFRCAITFIERLLDAVERTRYFAVRKHVLFVPLFFKYLSI